MSIRGSRTADTSSPAKVAEAEQLAYVHLFSMGLARLASELVAVREELIDMTNEVGLDARLEAVRRVGQTLTLLACIAHVAIDGGSMPQGFELFAIERDEDGDSVRRMLAGLAISEVPSALVEAVASIREDSP